MNLIKRSIFFASIFFLTESYSQQEVDIGKPSNTSFEVGVDIQGTIQNSVNEVTGKVTSSESLAAIAAASAAYNINLTYNGQASFKNGQQTNKYNPTSTVGVGWSMGSPKITVDHKNTGAKWQ